MKRFLVLLFVMPCLIGILAGSAQANTSARPAAIARISSPTDAQIEATIRTKLAKSKIGKDGFRFKVAHGVVTWEGTTNVVQHKGSATRMAKAAGATQVVNNIQVSATGKAKATAGLKKAYVQQ
ncbi:MAG: BON domain-containing protein [Acidobacteriaceae bacterium]|nr:BON domain-containing protein [Acidobacteriaceae bacterium]